MTTETNAPVVDFNDDFDVFMNLEDVAGTGFDKDTIAKNQEDYEAYKAEKAKESTFDFLNDDSESDDNDSFNPDDYDFSMLDNNNPIFDEDEESQEAEEEATDNTEQQEETDEASDNTLPTADDYDDGYTLAYEDLVTLPDGREVTVQDMADRYLAQEEFESRMQAIAEQELNFENQRKHFEEDLNLARLETDHIISTFDNVDWYALSIENPESYAQNKPFYDDMIAKRNHINARAAQLKIEAEQREQQEFQEKAKASVQILKATIPGWSDKLYSNILDHAIHDLGWSEERAQKEIDVGVIKALHNSMILSEGKKKVEKVATIKRSRTATRSVSPGASTKGNNEQINLDMIAAKYNAGKISQADAFRFLQD